MYIGTTLDGSDVSVYTLYTVHYWYAETTGS